MQTSTETTKIQVIARLVAKTESIEALKLTLNELVAPVRQQPGCLQYDLLQDQAQATNFVFVEVWESKAALDAHSASKVMQTAGNKINGLLATPIEISLYNLVV